jgi:hypothetical protein
LNGREANLFDDCGGVRSGLAHMRRWILKNSVEAKTGLWFSGQFMIQSWNPTIRPHRIHRDRGGWVVRICTIATSVARMTWGLNKSAMRLDCRGRPRRLGDGRQIHRGAECELRFFVRPCRTLFPFPVTRPRGGRLPGARFLVRLTTQLAGGSPFDGDIHPRPVPFAFRSGRPSHPFRCVAEFKDGLPHGGCRAYDEKGYLILTRDQVKGRVEGNRVCSWRARWDAPKE